MKRVAVRDRVSSEDVDREGYWLDGAQYSWGSSFEISAGGPGVTRPDALLITFRVCSATEDIFVSWDKREAILSRA